MDPDPDPHQNVMDPEQCQRDFGACVFLPEFPSIPSSVLGSLNRLIPLCWQRFASEDIHKEHEYLPLISTKNQPSVTSYLDMPGASHVCP